MEFISKTNKTVVAFKWERTRENTIKLVKHMSRILGKEINISINRNILTKRPTAQATAIVLDGLVFKFFGQEQTANDGDYIVYCDQNKIFYPLSEDKFEAMYNPVV